MRLKLAVVNIRLKANSKNRAVISGEVKQDYFIPNIDLFSSKCLNLLHISEVSLFQRFNGGMKGHL